MGENTYIANGHVLIYKPVRISTCFVFLFCVLLLSAPDVLAQQFSLHKVAGGTLSMADGTLATDVIFHTSGPLDIACDAIGNIYVIDTVSQIRKIDAASGVIYTIAGIGTMTGSSGDGGPATAARISAWGNICTDPSCNIYFSDASSKVRRIDAATGVITTFAGSGTSGTSGDGGPAIAALLDQPTGLCADATGNVYICTNGRIRKVNTSTGIISSLTGAAAGVTANGICADNMGNIYVTIGHNAKRINVASGTVTNVAGTGTGGYSGDGGPAVAAELLGPTGICINNSTGKLYVIEGAFGDIREVDLVTGMIRTVVGRGTGAWEEGSFANCVDLGGTSNFNFLKQGMSGSLLFSIPSLSLWGGKLLSALPITSGSSTSGSSRFDVSIDPHCSGVTFRASMDTFMAGHSVHSTFGDGTSGTYAFSPALACSNAFVDISHAYYLPGVYSVKHVLMYGGMAVDSVIQTFHNTQCRIIPVKVYYDANTSCGMDTSESYYNNPLSMAIDSAGIPIDTFSVISGSYYDAKGPVGTIYKFTLLPSVVTAVCPSTGIVYDTIGVGPGLPHLIGVTCSTSAYKDLSIYTTSITGKHASRTWSLVSNLGCLSAAPEVEVHCSPKYSGSVDVYGPISGSAVLSPNSAYWHAFPINSTSVNPQFTIYFHLLGPDLPIGDTVLYEHTVQPLTGDIDPSNNEMVIIDTVRTSYDPNIIGVNKHCFDDDATWLTYTIHFENMGNDTAYNVHVLDTLSGDVDIKSLQLLATSHPMFTYKYSDGPCNIIKFDFPNIKLLDSAWHGLNDGMFVYKIKASAGISTGTSFGQRVGIYFDDNEVVMTNTAYSTKGCPATHVDNIVGRGNISLYPNPTTSELNIRTDHGAFATFIITNAIGQQVLQDEITGARTTISVKDLPAGVYSITLSGQQGREVRKFVKW